MSDSSTPATAASPAAGWRDCSECGEFVEVRPDGLVYDSGGLHTCGDRAAELLGPDYLVGLAFPVIRVRYAGPTDYRGSRYIATLRGVRYVEGYDYAHDGSRNAYNAAVACWAKYRARYAASFQGDEQRRVFIPGDLDADSYAFTVVPAGFLKSRNAEGEV